MKFIKIINVKSEVNKITCEFNYSKDLSDIFNCNQFFVEYKENIDNIPESIKVIPVIANLITIAWFENADIYVNEIDEDFFYALGDVKISFEEMFSINITSKIYAQKKIKNNIDTKINRSATLFSGGIDGLSTFVNKKEENLALMSIWGADVKLNDIHGWSKVERSLSEFGHNKNVDNIFAKSNFRVFLNEATLNNNHKNVIKDGWWPNVQHGLGLIGVLAPMAYKNNIGIIFIPSSYTEEFNKPWGSDPKIDNKIRFSDIKIIHEGYELSRQGKIKEISKYIKNEDLLLPIRVCWEKEGGGNCCKCEKCCRTIIGLLLENIEVTNNGFDIDKKIYSYVKRMLKYSCWKFSDDELFMWKDIQKNIPNDISEFDDEKKEFFLWLKNYNINKVKENYFKMGNVVIRKINKALSKI